MYVICWQNVLFIATHSHIIQTQHESFILKPDFKMPNCDAVSTVISCPWSSEQCYITLGAVFHRMNGFDLTSI